MDVPKVVVKPGEGRSVRLGGMGVVFKASGADTGRAFAAPTARGVRPGCLPCRICAGYEGLIKLRLAERAGEQ